MSTDIENPFLQFAADKPAWASARNRLGTGYAQLVIALKNIGTGRAIRMSQEEYKRRFPAKLADASIKNHGRRSNMMIKIVRYNNEVCITYNDRQLYKKTETGYKMEA